MHTQGIYGRVWQCMPICRHSLPATACLQAGLGSQGRPFVLGSSPGDGRKRRRPWKPPAAPQIPADADLPAAAAQKPAEEHILIQQWGFEVIVRVVPLGWKASQSTTPERRKTSLESHSIYSNPLYTSEDTSQSSVSDDAGVLPVSPDILT